MQQPPAVVPRLQVFPTAEEAARAVAGEMAAAAARGAVFGLATGASPLGVYAELVRRHREEGLRFAGCTTFNLDEYWPLAAEHPQSFRQFMRRHLIGAIDLPAGRFHCPDGAAAEPRLPAACAAYEAAIAAAGGIDWQLLGIGRNGHIGFNEPGSPADSRTRRIDLSPETRADAAADFGSLDAVPRQAITMGVATILQARRIVLLAFGAKKREIVRRALEGPLGPDVPASFLRRHPDVTFVLDRAAAP